MAFEKMYARDFSIMMEEAWAYAITIGFEKKYGLRSPYQTPALHYYNDGAVVVWEDPEAIKWISDQLLEKCKDEEFLPELMAEYQKILEYFKPIWKKGYVETVPELVEFCNKMFDTMVYFVSYYFLAIDERTPQKTRELAVKIREEDPFFYSNDPTIRESLRKIYPILDRYITVISNNEISAPPAREVLEQRWKNWVVIPGKVKEMMTLENFAKKYPEYKFAFEHAESAAKELKGQIAFKGIIKGKVKILRRQEQVKDVQEGDILVSPMTTPDFLPAMKKAAAYVTDEGGMLCHAAIVARELKKPCVIGTKFATEIFKNGDQIEVDADNGVVKKVA